MRDSYHCDEYHSEDLCDKLGERCDGQWDEDSVKDAASLRRVVPS